MLEQLHIYARHITAVAAMLVILLAARKKLWAAILTVHAWFTAPAKVQAGLVTVTETLDAISIRLEDLTSKSDTMHHAVFNGGKDGLLHNIEFIKALTQNATETEPQPMFACRTDGSNLRVNAAYRVLVQVWHDDDLGGTQWQSVIHGELKDAYIQGYDRAAARNEDYIGDVDFRNPMTNEHRGRWKIHITASKTTSGGAIYIGRFIGALDDTAKGISSRNNWTCKHL